MAVLGTEDLVDDIAVVGQENEAGRVFVEPSDREDSFAVADFRNDIAGHVSFARCRNADRFVVPNVNRCNPPGNNLPISGDNVAWFHLVANFCKTPVNCHTSGFDEPVSLPSRADTLLGKEFIDADRVNHESGAGSVDLAAGSNTPEHAID